MTSRIQDLLDDSATLVDENVKYTSKEFSSDQDVRWCPGCGDYTILKQVQNSMPDLGISKEQIVFISGIGCAARFPYYMDTFGMHSIHGRAPAIATGLKVSRPDLSVWVITGDGDSLSIGGNHFIHLLRRNVNMNVLLFNNQIYGLTKGQYSPTSPLGTTTKSTPLGSLDNPFNPLALALGADGGFIARAMDRDPKHLKDMILRAHKHPGTSLLEIYQNCIVFNDGAFGSFTDKQSRADNTIYLEQHQPLIFGSEKNKGIRLDGFIPEVVTIGEDYNAEDLWIHDEQDLVKAQILARFFHQVDSEGRLKFPRPFGVFYDVQRPIYDEMVMAQNAGARERNPNPDLDDLLKGNETWVVS
jgi:2-oxoglutarate ferredoxin oxidoreductase subunit beta